MVSAFSVKVGANQFDSQHLKVNLDDPECQLTGEIQLGLFNPWPGHLLLPGADGWFCLGAGWNATMACSALITACKAS